MTDRITTLTPNTQGYLTSSPERNKVLRNTYGLLSLSLLPTVAGAWLGVATGVGSMLNGIIGMLVYLGIAFGFIYALRKPRTRRPACRCCWALPSSWASCSPA